MAGRGGGIAGIGAAGQSCAGAHAARLAIWFLAQRKLAIGLRTRWPYWPLAALVLSYAPVIAYNLRYEWVGVSVADTGRMSGNPNLSRRSIY